MADWSRCRAFARRCVMGEAAERLLRSCAPARRWATISRRFRNVCRRRGPGCRFTVSRSESGPDHRKRFLVEVRAQERQMEGRAKPLARGMGSTKKHAEQDAARRALDTADGSAKAATRRVWRERGGASSAMSTRCPAAAASPHLPLLRGCTFICLLCRRRWPHCCDSCGRAFSAHICAATLLIPSESMERTLLVGDFLLFNKQVYAPAGQS